MRRHFATRSGVHSRGFGRSARGNSTSTATFTSNNPSRTRRLSKARRVSRIRCNDKKTR
ncbi:hypothetical protein GCM10027360_25140 [Amycolatopsis echigonensis]